MGIVVAMHTRMQSTQRKAETVTSWESLKGEMQAAASQEQRARALCGALELVLSRLHVVRVDTANNKLKNIAPVIREHGVEYERSHFTKKVCPRPAPLSRTRSFTPS